MPEKVVFGPHVLASKMILSQVQSPHPTSLSEMNNHFRRVEETQADISHFLQEHTKLQGTISDNLELLMTSVETNFMMLDQQGFEDSLSCTR